MLCAMMLLLLVVGFLFVFCVVSCELCSQLPAKINDLQHLTLQKTVQLLTMEAAAADAGLGSQYPSYDEDEGEHLLADAAG
jgi:hypothetical protein